MKIQIRHGGGAIVAIHHRRRQEYVCIMVSQLTSGAIGELSDVRVDTPLAYIRGGNRWHIVTERKL
jgi:hypothetical protein